MKKESGTCVDGTCLVDPCAGVDCSALSDPCNVGACDAGGQCVATPKPDGTDCGASGETCQDGSCRPPTACACDLGQQWRECESSSLGAFCGTWTRRGTGDVWDGQWDNDAIGELVVACDGTNVHVSRRDPTGISAGLTAEYDGAWVEGCGSVRGTMCFSTGPCGEWNATVE